MAFVQCVDYSISNVLFGCMGMVGAGVGVLGCYVIKRVILS